MELKRLSFFLAGRRAFSTSLLSVISMIVAMLRVVPGMRVTLAVTLRISPDRVRRSNSYEPGVSSPSILREW